MHHRAPRARRTALAVAVPIGLVTSLALTWGSTQAAFYASTGNAGNSWQTGSVVLDHSASGSALFTSASDGALKPGLPPRSRCIRLDYTGSLPADIRMYVGTPSGGATALDPYLVMSVERGADVLDPDTVAADCSTGFESRATPTFLFNSEQADGDGADPLETLTELKGNGDYATGLVVEDETAPDTHLTLKITYLVRDEQAAHDTESTATFTWEARNT